METLLNFAEKNILFSALLGFMLLDVLSGLAAATVQKKLSSPISYAGMSRKFMMIIMVFTAHMMDWLAAHTTSYQPPIAGMVMLFFNIREIISITENATLCNLPIPAAIKDRLAVMQNTDPGKLIAIAGGFLQTAPTDQHMVAALQASQSTAAAGNNTTTTATTTTTIVTSPKPDGEPTKE